MNIVINGRFLNQRITGVQRYAREICLELDKIISYGELTIAIPPETKEVPNYKNIKIIKIGHFHNRLWEHISFPLYLFRKRAVPLNLCNVSPLLIPGIVCIHDVKIKARPDFFSMAFTLWYRLLFFNAIKRAKRIITVSEFSKSEILKYYNISKDKICVIPSAWQHFKRIAYDNNTLIKYGLEKGNYYYAMSSLEPSKNFKWIAQRAAKDRDAIYAVAGSINEKVFSNGIGFECPTNMRFLGYVSDQEAKTLMRDCKAFLFPSIYEGFGLPPLEAMSAGAKRIVVSDIPVMHEIFKDSVEYISQIECKESKEQNNIKSSSIILNYYNWRNNAKLLLEILKEINC